MRVCDLATIILVILAGAILGWVLSWDIWRVHLP